MVVKHQIVIGLLMNMKTILKYRHLIIVKRLMSSFILDDGSKYSSIDLNKKNVFQLLIVTITQTNATTTTKSKIQHLSIGVTY